MKKIIIDISFNKNKLNQFRLNKEWIDYRMSIFMNYTFKSLINQTNQSFTAIIHYDELSEVLIQSALSQYNLMPSNIIFTSSGNALIKKIIHGYDYLYIVRLDSDDMYHPNFIQQLIDFEHTSNLECIVNKEGYVYDIVGDNLGIWYAQSPPFFTLIYKVQDYLSGFRYILNSHTNAIKLNHYVFNSGNFMVILHGQNTSTKFNHPFVRNIIDNSIQKKIILNNFNLSKD